MACPGDENSPWRGTRAKALDWSCGLCKINTKLMVCGSIDQGHKNEYTVHNLSAKHNTKQSSHIIEEKEGRTGTRRGVVKNVLRCSHLKY